MATEETEAPYPSDEYHFHRCPVEGCGASILCTGQTQGACDARITAAVAEEDEFTPSAHAAEALARNREMMSASR